MTEIDGAERTAATVEGMEAVEKGVCSDGEWQMREWRARGQSMPIGAVKLRSS